MPFGNFAFTRLFRLTGTTAPVTTVYLDLRVRDEVVMSKLLTFDIVLNGWTLSLSEVETAAHDGQRLYGHLVTVIGGVHAPQAYVQIDIARSLTARKP